MGLAVGFGFGFGLGLGLGLGVWVRGRGKVRLPVPSTSGSVGGAKAGVRRSSAAMGAMSGVWNAEWRGSTSG